MYLIMYNGQNKVSKVGFADDLIPRQLLFVKVYDIMMTYDYNDEKYYDYNKIPTRSNVRNSLLILLN